MPGVPEHGSTKLMTHRGTLNKGLKLAGTLTYSGESNNINTTAIAITFDAATFPANGTGRVPRHIRFKSAQVLTIYMGGTGASTTAAAGWSNSLACTDLFEGKEVWKIKAAAQTALEFEIDYT